MLPERYGGGPERFQGRHGAAEVLAGRGPEALARVLDASGDLLPPHLRQLLERLAAAAPALREEVVERVLRSETAAQSPQLVEHLRQELARRVGTREVDPIRVEAVLAQNVSRLRTEHVLGLGAFVDAPAVRDRLRERVLDRSAVGDARLAALEALAGHVDAELGAELLAIALDASEPRPIREAAVARLADAPEALLEPIEGAWRAMREPALRALLGEVALELGGRATLERIAAAGLPPGPYLREELGRVARRLAGLGDPDLAARFAAHEDAATAWVGVAAGGADPARFADDPRRVELVRDGSVLLGELIAELGE